MARRWQASRRRLAEVELAARNLESFSTTDPSITKAVQLPDWTNSAKMGWPPPRSFDPASFAPVAADRRDWWQVKEEEARALRTRQEREEKEREAKVLENYHGPRWWARERI